MQFIALIYMSALGKKIQEAKLDHKYTVRELLLEMETLTKLRYSGKYGHILTEVTKPQRLIMEKLAIGLTPYRRLIVLASLRRTKPPQHQQLLRELKSDQNLLRHKAS